MCGEEGDVLLLQKKTRAGHLLVCNFRVVGQNDALSAFFLLHELGHAAGEVGLKVAVAHHVGGAIAVFAEIVHKRTRGADELIEAGRNAHPGEFGNVGLG